MTASSFLNQYKLLYCRTCHSKCVDLKVLLHYSSITEQDRNEEWRDIIEFYATDWVFNYNPRQVFNDLITVNLEPV